MIGTRGAIRARHELRFGSRELVAFGAAGFLVCVLTFVGGVLVGREMGGGARSSAKASASAAGGAEPAGPASPGSPGSKITPARTEERLTFYKTLTAPTPDLPLPKQPTIEERIVPKEELPAVLPEPKPEKRPAPAVARPESTARARPSGELQLWTIQVSSFRSRALAEELRARLATRGLDAYLLSAATEEGRVRYRVRVGAYPTRTEAERVAADLRSDRTLSPFVTPRSR